MARAGKNSALCENIAHTYNSLGDYPKAEDYFRQALQLIEAGCTAGSAGALSLTRTRSIAPPPPPTPTHFL